MGKPLLDRRMDKILRILNGEDVRVSRACDGYILQAYLKQNEEVMTELEGREFVCRNGWVSLLEIPISSEIYKFKWTPSSPIDYDDASTFLDTIQRDLLNYILITGQHPIEFNLYCENGRLRSESPFLIEDDAPK